jgi:hypothetical protein
MLFIFAKNLNKKKMKKTIILAMAFLALYVNAQTTGLGKLQIGMDIKELPELSSEKKIKTSSEYFKSVYQKYSGTDFYEITMDSTDKLYQNIGSLDKSVRVFCVGYFKLTETIAIIGVTLKFKDSKLYSIYCERDENLNDGLKIKFGEPKIEVEEKQKEYINGLGLTIVKVDKEYTSLYNTGFDNIKCKSYYSTKHNEKGEESFSSYTVMEDKSICKEVFTNEMQEKAKIREMLNNISKEKYKGL